MNAGAHDRSLQRDAVENAGRDGIRARRVLLGVPVGVLVAIRVAGPLLAALPRIRPSLTSSTLCEGDPGVNQLGGPTHTVVRRTPRTSEWLRYAVESCRSNSRSSDGGLDKGSIAVCS